MAQAHQAPFTADFLQPAQQEAPEPTRFLDLPKYGLDDDLAPGLQRLPFRGLHFGRHALFGRGRGLQDLRRQDMMPLTLRRHGGLEPSGLQRLHRRLTVIATVQGRWNRLQGARLVFGALHTSLGQGHQRGLGHRLSLRRIVRGVGDVTG